jgi:hypothetical protein
MGKHFSKRVDDPLPEIGDYWLVVCASDPKIDGDIQECFIYRTPEEFDTDFANECNENLVIKEISFDVCYKGWNSGGVETINDNCKTITRKIEIDRSLPLAIQEEKLREKTRLTINDIEAEIGQKPADIVDISFGGGDMCNYDGHEVVYDELDKHFKPTENEENRPFLWPAHDYYELSIGEDDKDFIKKLRSQNSSETRL